MKPVKLLILSGSPIIGGSTDLLLQEIEKVFASAMPLGISVESQFVRLHDLKGLPCKSCGEAPQTGYCIYDDDISDLYEAVASCDCFLFGSPIYFDSVSAQAKLFMDRCNCFRPADFDNVVPDHDFIKLLKRKRPGGMVLVGGEDGWFEGARRSIAGFFKWIEVTNEGMVAFRSENFRKKGLAGLSDETLKEADRLGKVLAQKVTENCGR